MSAAQVLAGGSNFYGELGNGTTTDNDEPEGVHLPAGITYTVVRCGLSAFAVSNGSRLYAWGNNAAGPLGDGTTTDRLMPVRVKRPPGVRVTGISAGKASPLAITRSGRLLSWGSNGNGELGNGSDNSALVPVKVESGIFHATSIGAGPGASTALAAGTFPPA